MKGAINLYNRLLIKTENGFTCAASVKGGCIHKCNCKENNFCKDFIMAVCQQLNSFENALEESEVKNI